SLYLAQCRRWFLHKRDRKYGIRKCRIAGQRNNTFRSVVREVRVFFHEFVEQRNKVVVASVSLSVGICVLMQYFIAFQDESIRKSVALHIFVVRQVIKREDQRLLA